MDDIKEFLAHAVKLEEEAAHRFADLAETMRIYGNTDIAEFFGRMAHFSRLHLAEARKRCGFRDVPDLPAEELSFPEGESPEAASMAASHYIMTIEQALETALDSERAGLAWYAQIARDTTDPEVRMMAEEFADEEREHVAELERWVALRDGGTVAA
ncbi:ferritin family protein [Azospirillum sp. RWY-5-1]|uniref:Ferritin family protein n=1 Tax=Azospirillum oleiclasticum TaxID=2735135 RepID=A0ABX2T2I3_9PROT|nr:ferritin family protein [Azospirillum oleiclasticum]NYZ11268.1 ferritin family protein [Azospirillum oleiclasticum]NYZ18429.1 ferritin family protein [Azospirillum oleiclasticum]